ncbi:MAG: hypothetical protein ACP5MD_03430, partial [Verrucomicrobiia bacterium]
MEAPKAKERVVRKTVPAVALAFSGWFMPLSFARPNAANQAHCLSLVTFRKAGLALRRQPESGLSVLQHMAYGWSPTLAACGVDDRVHARPSREFQPAFAAFVFMKSVQEPRWI